MTQENSIKTFGSIFTGFGLMDIGASMAGFLPLWGIEKDDKISSVASQNLEGNIISCDVLQVSPNELSGKISHVTWLHASPPCPNFSQAKNNSAESSEDISLAKKVCEFISYSEPTFFTLENVTRYLKSYSIMIIGHHLLKLGYNVNTFVVNSANFGVPQTRMRMFLISSPSPVCIPETHNKSGCNNNQKWATWYDAIIDIYPQCESSVFSKWQIPHIEKWISKNGDIPFIMPGENSSSHVIRSMYQPSSTVTTQRHSSILKASIGGRVVKLNSRCAARLQSMPDWYKLPDDQKLAMHGIGNGVPCLMAKQIGISLVNSLDKYQVSDVQCS